MGYFLYPTKSISVVLERNVIWYQRFFRGRGLIIVMGSLYLRGYIGDAGYQVD